MDKENEYGKGKMNALNEMLSFVKKEISVIKERPVVPNSNRQITNGGKLLAYNKVLQKLLFKLRNVKQRL